MILKDEDFSSCLSFTALDIVPRQIEQVVRSNLKTSDMVKRPYSILENGEVKIELFFPRAHTVSAFINKELFEFEREGEYFTKTLPLQQGLSSIVVLLDGNPVLYPYLPIAFGHNQPMNFIRLPFREYCEISDHVPHGSVTAFFIPNSVTGRMSRIQVYLPPDHRREDKTDVLFLQHGFGENDISWVGEARVNFILDNLISSGRTTPLMVVMADGMLRKIDEEGNIRIFIPEFKDYLLNDIIPFIRERFNPGKYFIAGLSMGSIQASICGLEHPEFFSGIGLFSGFVNDYLSGYCEHVKPENFEKLEQRNIPFFRGIGDSDRYMSEFLKDDRCLESLKFRHERRIYSGNHEWNVWIEMIVDFLDLIEKGRK